MSDDPRIEAAARVLGDMAVISDERCRNIAEDMLAAADRAAWRPISEAPIKGGGYGEGTGPTLLLNYPGGTSPSGSGEKVHLGHWLDNTRFNPPWAGFRPIPRGSIPWGRPDRYQPLPAPPEDSQEQEEGRD